MITKIEIENMIIGSTFSIRKSGKCYEYLGLCPIENVPCGRLLCNFTIEYFEPSQLIYTL